MATDKEGGGGLIKGKSQMYVAEKQVYLFISVACNDHKRKIINTHYMYSADLKGNATAHNINIKTVEYYIMSFNIYYLLIDCIIDWWSVELLLSQH